MLCTTQYQQLTSANAGHEVASVQGLCGVAGSVLLEAAPAVGTMTGADLLAALSKGSEMRKAWEGGSGGSNRLVQCFVNEGQAYIAYGHGWLRKAVQYPLDRSEHRLFKASMLMSCQAYKSSYCSFGWHMSCIERWVLPHSLML